VASDEQGLEEHRRRIWAMAPEDRASLAALIRRGRDKIPDKIAKLEQQYTEVTAWLAEFDPDGDNGQKTLAEQLEETRKRDGNAMWSWSKGRGEGS
jgi:hypothetical protein